MTSNWFGKTLKCLLFLPHSLAGQIAVQPILSSGIPGDVEWDFTSSLEEWGEGTPDRMHADVFHKDGHMIIELLGQKPYLDSPMIELEPATRQTIALRYAYFGSSTLGMVEIYQEDRVSSQQVLFPLVNRGLWDVAYAEINSTMVEGSISRIRVWPAIDGNPEGGGMEVDWIRISRAPILRRVMGCAGNMESDSPNFETVQMGRAEAVVETTNEILCHHRTEWKQHETSQYSHARTYNCKRQGGDLITLEGSNFGIEEAIVEVDGLPCFNITHNADRPQEIVTCVTPPMTSDQTLDPKIAYSIVALRNGAMPGLQGFAQILRYALAPPPPVNLTIFNIAAKSVDLTWNHGGNLWEQMSSTGFLIEWRFNLTKEYHNMVVGNVTTTTAIDLKPNTLYQFSISALNEDQRSSEWYATLDNYGRRSKLDHALKGEPSHFVETRTLANDFLFEFFNSNSTLNHIRGEFPARLGPTGNVGDEGHYGMELVGDASIQNCNASSICCDSKDLGSCANSLTCRWASKGFSSWHPQSSPPTFLSIKTYEELSPRHVPASSCGPALRLTGSYPRRRGSAWYARSMNVGEGFETEFQFEIHTPSQRCNNHNEVYRYCRSRGADGLAFVIQNHQSRALGNEGFSLGYGGIPNSLAIEFDTYYNYEMGDLYENHVSIQSRGSHEPNESNHTFSLAHTASIPDLTDGVIKARIVYSPQLDPDVIFEPNFQVNSKNMIYFQEHHGWNLGPVGMISVFVNEMKILVTPMNISATINLNHGRAYVGFTASTGMDTWQTHDVLSWKFTSLRQDREVLPMLPIEVSKNLT